MTPNLIYPVNAIDRGYEFSRTHSLSTFKLCGTTSNRNDAGST